MKRARYGGLSSENKRTKAALITVAKPNAAWPKIIKASIKTKTLIRCSTHTRKTGHCNLAGGMCSVTVEVGLVRNILKTTKSIIAASSRMMTAWVVKKIEEKLDSGCKRKWHQLS